MQLAIVFDLSFSNYCSHYSILKLTCRHNNPIPLQATTQNLINIQKCCYTSITLNLNNSDTVVITVLPNVRIEIHYVYSCKRPQLSLWLQTKQDKHYKEQLSLYKATRFKVALAHTHHTLTFIVFTSKNSDPYNTRI